MSKRWKLQLGYGIAFTVIMALLNNAIYYVMEPTLIEWPVVLWGALFNFLFGTFVLGYMQWRFTQKKPKKQ